MGTIKVTKIHSAPKGTRAIIQMATRSTSGAITHIFSNVVRHVVSTCNFIFYLPKRTKTKLLLIVRPIDIAGFYELTRMDTGDKRGGSLSRQTGEKTMDVPSAITVRLRNKHILNRGFILLTHIPHELGQVIAEGKQVITVTFSIILCSGKEVVPLITKRQLDNDRAGTAAGRIQLSIMVGILLVVPEGHQRSIRVLKLDELIQTVTIFLHSVIRTDNFIRSHKFQHLPGNR